MLTRLLVGAIIIGWTGFYNWSIQTQTASLPVSQTNMTSAATVTFEEDVLPILKTNCNPCHFPGGKLYEKLPFDKPSTIINHSEGILKRISKEEDQQKIRLFVEQNSNQPKI